MAGRRQSPRARGGAYWGDSWRPALLALRLPDRFRPDWKENACLGPNAGVPVVYAARFLIVGPKRIVDDL